MGQYVLCEVHTSQGRCDCVVETEAYVYLFEFKKDASADEALTQMKEKNYGEKYRASGKKIIFIGVSFSPTARDIAQWKQWDEI